MKYVTNHPTYGEIQLDWGFWTGKFKLAIGGKELKKVSKTGFELQLPDSEAPISVQVFGNNFKGFGVMIGTQPIQISPPAKWYDFVFAITAGTIWFVMIGGAIGGAFAGGWSVATLYLLLSRPIIKHKILIGIGSIVSSAVLSLILSVILAALFQSLGLI